MITTANGTKATKVVPAPAVEPQESPEFDLDREYTFAMRSFRFRNGWCFCTVSYKGTNIEILIGQSSDYQLPAMLQAKQFGGNVYGTYKGPHSHNGEEFPRFWNVSVG